MNFRNNFKSLLDSVMFDSNDSAKESFDSLAECYIANAEANGDWSEFYDCSPEEITGEMVEKATSYLNENWNCFLQA